MSFLIAGLVPWKERAHLSSSGACLEGMPTFLWLLEEDADIEGEMMAVSPNILSFLLAVTSLLTS